MFAVKGTYFAVKFFYFPYFLQQTAMKFLILWK